MTYKAEFNIHNRLRLRHASLAVIGTGYVGLPVLMEFSRYFDVIGYDIDRSVIERARERLGSSVRLSESEQILDEASFFIVTVATPIDGNKKPDLIQLKNATASVGRHLKRGSYVVFESTVYPECTEAVCIPILERESGLKAGDDFKVGYSPERINPGDKSHTFANTVKVVSASDPLALDEISKVYSTVVTAGVSRASSIKVAEASKIVENIQRSVNIALMNELHRLFHHMGIDFSEVREMAATKWNFGNYRPGLVGGHCIPVDPYYLLSEASKMGIDIPVTRSGCIVNDSMASFIAETIYGILSVRDAQTLPKVLIMGITYKPDTDDIRNSQAAEIYRLLNNESAEVDVTDPCANPDKVYTDFGISLVDTQRGPYDIIIVAVGHKQYAGFDDSYFRSISKSEKSVLVDIGCRYKGKIKSIGYLGI